MAGAPPAVALEDIEPPVVYLLRPAAGSVTDSQQPLILIHFSDSGVGVDPRSLRLYLDGGRVFEGQNVRESTLSYLPPFPLATGQHRVEVALEDLAGNRATYRWNFGVASFEQGLMLGRLRLSGANTLTAGTSSSGGAPGLASGPVSGMAENEVAIFGAGGLAGRNMTIASLKLRSALSRFNSQSVYSGSERFETKLVSYTLSWQGEDHQLIVGDNQYPADPWLSFSQRRGKGVHLRIFPGERRTVKSGADAELFWSTAPEGGPEATGVKWRSASPALDASGDLQRSWSVLAFLVRAQGASVNLYDLRMPEIIAGGIRIGMELAGSRQINGGGDEAFRITSIKKNGNARIEASYQRVGADFFNGLNPTLETDREGVNFHAALVWPRLEANIRLGRWRNNLRRERPDTLQKLQAGLELEMPLQATGNLIVGYKKISEEEARRAGMGLVTGSGPSELRGTRDVVELQYARTWKLFGKLFWSTMGYSRDLLGSGTAAVVREKYESSAGTTVGGFRAEGRFGRAPVEQIDTGTGQAENLTSRGISTEGELKMEREVLMGKAKLNGRVMVQSQRSLTIRTGVKLPGAAGAGDAPVNETKVFRTEWSWGTEYRLSNLAEIHFNGGYRVKKVISSDGMVPGREAFATFVWVRRF
ncbi:MAG: hypothetical protein ACM3TT_13065 [Syntrophothermus sp.]